MATEPWLNGPLEGVDPLLMPAAHALMQARGDILSIVSEMSEEEIKKEIDGIPSVAFHLRHIDGSIDRLLAYTKGKSLTDEQFKFLAKERTGIKNSGAELIEAAVRRIDEVLDVIRATPNEIFFEPRFVGRARLETNVIGLIFHLAEHTQRHLGSLIVAAKIARLKFPENVER